MYTHFAQCSTPSNITLCTLYNMQYWEIHNQCGGVCVHSEQFVNTLWAYCEHIVHCINTNSLTVQWWICSQCAGDSSRTDTCEFTIFVNFFFFAIKMQDIRQFAIDAFTHLVQCGAVVCGRPSGSGRLCGRPGPTPSNSLVTNSHIPPTPTYISIGNDDFELFRMYPGFIDFNSCIYLLRQGAPDASYVMMNMMSKEHCGGNMRNMGKIWEQWKNYMEEIWEM